MQGFLKNATKELGEWPQGGVFLGEDLFNSDSCIATFNSIALDSTGPAGVNRIHP
jgi:hypothetical protein